MVEPESSGWLQSVLVKICNKLSRLRKGHLFLNLESKLLARIICAIKRRFFWTESAFWKEAASPEILQSVRRAQHGFLLLSSKDIRLDCLCQFRIPSPCHIGSSDSQGPRREIAHTLILFYLMVLLTRPFSFVFLLYPKDWRTFSNILLLQKGMGGQGMRCAFPLTLCRQH